MKRTRLKILIAISNAIVLIFMGGCVNTVMTEEVYSPKFNPADFAKEVNNEYFTLTPGNTFIYEGETGDGLEHIEVTVMNDTKVIIKVECVVVWDRVWLNNELIEETIDWYAQDKNGNVWYFGEDSKECENGEIISTKGSWEAGVDGAKPGIIMEASPKIGDSYREEYYKGEAEDIAEIISLDESVKIPYSPSYHNCLKTKNWTPLEPDIVEYKYYSSEVGGVVLETMADGTDRMELINIITN